MLVPLLSESCKAGLDVRPWDASVVSQNSGSVHHLVWIKGPTRVCNCHIMPEYEWHAKENTAQPELPIKHNPKLCLQDASSMVFS